jgi:hypothetical protein
MRPSDPSPGQQPWRELNCGLSKSIFGQGEIMPADKVTDPSMRRTARRVCPDARFLQALAR